MFIYKWSRPSKVVRDVGLLVDQLRQRDLERLQGDHLMGSAIDHKIISE